MRTTQRRSAPLLARRKRTLQSLRRPRCAGGMLGLWTAADASMVGASQLTLCCCPDGRSMEIAGSAPSLQTDVSWHEELLLKFRFTEALQAALSTQRWEVGVVQRKVTGERKTCATSGQFACWLQACLGKRRTELTMPAPIPVSSLLPPHSTTTATFALGGGPCCASTGVTWRS